jgi:hypothetical protein
MNGIAAVAVAIGIAAVGVSWFLNNPNTVTVKASPMQPNPALPTFKQVEEEAMRDARRQQNNQ